MINKTLLIAGGVALAGVGGFFVGKDYGQDQIQGKWDKATIEAQNKEIAYQYELQQTLTKLNEANNTIRDQVVTEYVDRVNTITQTKYENRDVIREVFKESPYLTKGWVYTHNSLVDGTQIDPALAADTTPSTFTESDSLVVIGNNYATARQAIAKDKGWNTFYAGVYNNYRLPSSGSVQNERSGEAGSSVDTYGPR